jgi:hypothetical protein
MRIVKLYRKADKPEFYILVRIKGSEMLLNYPIDVPDRKRQARWLNLNEVYIDWIREFL